MCISARAGRQCRLRHVSQLKSRTNLAEFVPDTPVTVLLDLDGVSERQDAEVDV